jgi:voltage-gated potassium channel
MRRRIYEILTNPRPGDLAGRIVSVALLLLIAANVAANVIETDVDLAARAPRLFLWFERVSVALFTLEYILRLWSCTADPRFSGSLGRLRLALRPMSVIDLAAIVPFYLDLFLAGTLDLRFLRALRLVRLFRLLRFGRLAEALAMMTRVVQAKRAELGITLALVGIAVLLSAGAIYTAEHRDPKTDFTSIPRAMWWSIVTITTVGYGDMAPKTPIGQVIGGVVAFIGICALALPVGILSTGFFDELKRVSTSPAPAMQTCPHCGGAVERTADLATVSRDGE